MYNKFIAYALWLVSGCGALGFHRFYLNKIPTGFLWFFTGGLGMVGSVYDFFTLGSQVREANLRIKYERVLNIAESNALNSTMLNDSSREYKRKRADKKSVERAILHAAKENQGAVTPSEIALETGLSVDQSKKKLEALTGKGFCDMRVTQNGTIVYYFNDFAPRGNVDDFEDLT